jgi:hypothetical protein
MSSAILIARLTVFSDKAGLEGELPNARIATAIIWVGVLYEPEHDRLD